MRNELNFLVIIDDTQEMYQAIRYAAMRAKRANGKVVILYTFDSLDFSHWKSVENIAEQELKEEAESKIKDYESLIFSISQNRPKKKGTEVPFFYISRWIEITWCL